jgi:hypothetical protein
MTTTPSKLGADMLNVPRELLQDLIDDVADYAMSRTFKDRETTWRSDLLKRADELLARQPAAIGKPFWQSTDDGLVSRVEKPAVPLVEQDDPKADLGERMQLARKAGLQLRIDSKFGSDHYHSVVGSWPALVRFACAFQARAASTSASVARLSIDDLQGKALEHGFKYWRASDAHGITGTAEQAENLIADLIGVEVEVTSQISPFADVAQGARPVPRDFFVPGQMARPFKAPDAGEHDPWYVALPNGNLIKLGFHADDSVDRAQAEFIADAINAALTASPAFALRALYTYADSANVAQGAENTDDIAIDSFARAMKEKMAAARAKGRSGWEGCEPADLSRMLREHVEKGDPRDVANFCMMLWHHSAPIASPAQTALTDDVLMQAIADTAARGHVWASRALSNFRAAVREAAKSPDDA